MYGLIKVPRTVDAPADSLHDHWRDLFRGSAFAALETNLLLPFAPENKGSPLAVARAGLLARSASGYVIHVSTALGMNVAAALGLSRSWLDHHRVRRGSTNGGSDALCVMGRSITLVGALAPWLTSSQGSGECGAMLRRSDTWRRDGTCLVDL